MTGPLPLSCFRGAVGIASVATMVDVASGIVVTAAVMAVPMTAWPRRNRMRSARSSSADW